MSIYAMSQSIAGCLRRVFFRSMRLYLTLFITVSFSVVATTVYAQENVDDYRRGLLWKIEKSNTVPSYLLGTMHVTDSRVVNFSKTINRLIESCDSVTLEAKFDMNSQMAVFNAMLLSNGKTLDDYISESEMTKVRSALMVQPMLAQMSGLLKPWAATLLLSLPKDASGLTMDALLQDRFMQLDKPVFQLESAVEQINIFENLSMNDQVDILRETIESIDEINAVLKETLEKYLNEDLAGLLELNNKHLEESKNKALPELLYRLIEERNHKMVNRMQDRLAVGNSLIAIGALHLPGTQGVLNLLDRQGYKVTPVVQER